VLLSTDKELPVLLETLSLVRMKGNQRHNEF
jgi:hypothetical protein